MDVTSIKNCIIPTTYECLLRDGKFIVARPKGHDWSEQERREFMFFEVDLFPEPADFPVQIDCVTVLASEIDATLVEGGA